MANPTTNFGWVMPTSSSLVTNLPADFNTFGQAVDTSMSELLGGTTGQVLSKTSNTNMDFTWVTPTDQTPLTTKGDLFTFSTVDARLAVGTNGQALVADSTTATGLKWATASGGSFQLVKAATTFTNVAGTSTTFDNVFSSSYKYYQVQIATISTQTTPTDDFQLQLLYSGTTQATGYYGTTFGNAHGGTSPSSTGTSNLSQFTICPDIGSGSTIDATNGVINFYKVEGSSSVAQFTGQTITGYNYSNFVFGGQSTTARTYTGFLLKSSSGNISGTVTVYGLANA